jgi:hypothetical protein
MVFLEDGKLVFFFPAVHLQARLEASFVRSVKVPQDGRAYAQPAQKDCLPIALVDDHRERLPPDWVEHGGVMLPVECSDAFYICMESAPSFDAGVAYPFAVKVGAGKISAFSGRAWDEDSFDTQDYAVVTGQCWIDGFCDGDGKVSQFVAQPLGMGHTLEEKKRPGPYWGGIQIAVYPMKPQAWAEFARHAAPRPRIVAEQKAPFGPDMGLAPGGKISQNLPKDPFGAQAWDCRAKSRCFVHLADAAQWAKLTGPSFSG